MIELPLRPLRIAIVLSAAVTAACSDHSAPMVSTTAAATATATAAPKSPYAAASRGRIDVEGGLLQLSIPGSGRITTISVREGDHIARGQELAALDTQAASLDVEEAQAQLSREKARSRSLTVQLNADRRRAQQLAKAADADAGSRQDADDAKSAAAQLRAEIDSSRASVRLAEVKLSQARYALKQQTLYSPVDATIVHINTTIGASVSPQSGTLFTLLPKRPLIVRAEVNAMYVDAVRPGMSATVVADGNPSTPGLRARVERIGAVYGPNKFAEDPAQQNNFQTVECILALDQAQNLRVGQKVLVRFNAETPGTPAQ